MHAARFAAVKVAIDLALTSQCATVTRLGRGIASTVDERYGIKRMDRLIGNARLLREGLSAERHAVLLLIKLWHCSLLGCTAKRHRLKTFSADIRRIP
ncbi:hypothetical protein [Thiohalomonas denitrificans]|uniref:Uncharacterized protein n=1 Tax=Thiohalomonas denitrificans TaxID=415747 RepID=A0A1G5QVX7_9GAMM|nr:hypothetical protein [Thiohalomonas denitrificans]SCZ65892.1 hypothetical protein SAMN03097708_02897 [Thiohalomonas denitrificans]